MIYNEPYRLFKPKIYHPIFGIDSFGLATKISLNELAKIIMGKWEFTKGVGGCPVLLLGWAKMIVGHRVNCLMIL